MKLMNKIKSTVSNLFYPAKCPYCLETLSEDTECCKKCKNSITRYDRITKVYESYSGSERVVSYCTAPLYYADNARQAILRYKFRGYTNFLNAFGISMYNSFTEYFSQNDYDLITAVPLCKSRLHTRGYNQSELLAKELSNRIDIPYEELLYHCKDNHVQHELSEEDRKENVKGVYSIIEANSVLNKNILVVDDIVTTKSTLGEVCKVLYEAGAKTVDCICLARAGLRH